MSQPGSRPSSQTRNRDGRDGPVAKEKYEERLKQAREKQEEERVKRLQGLEVTNQQAIRIREHLEAERRRKMDELKNKEFEKRHAVEERKRLIWEAEQERKEAMVRRNLDRENKLDAKRYAHRNASSFAFGSSTPRSMNLDMATLGPCRQSNVTLISSSPVSSRVYDTVDDETSRRRPMSVVVSNERSVAESIDASVHEIPVFKMQAVNSAYRSEQARACLTMTTLSDHDYHLNGIDERQPIGENLMTQSLVLLPSSARRRHPELTPVQPRERDTSLSTTRVNSEPVRTGPKRAISMTRLDQLARPRQRYLEETMKTRNSGNSNSLSPNNNCMVRSMYNLTTRTSSAGLKSSMRKATSKDAHLSSPTRPVSSLSGASENSSASAVQMRAQTARRVRPVSIAGSIPDSKSPARQSRTVEKKPASAANVRPNRAHSAGSSSSRQPVTGSESDSKSSTPKPAPPRKPAHVKAAAAARKSAKQQQQPLPKLDVKPEMQKPNSTSPAAASSPTTSTPVRELMQDSSPEPAPTATSTPTPAPTPTPTPVPPPVALPTPVEELPEENIEVKEEAKVEEVKEETSTVKELNVEAAKSEADAEEKKKKDITQEEYKRLLAEKRRIAREQAEREAELQRQKEEQLRREEEERQRKLEEEERRFEEEQLKLAQEHRKMEEEKLRKAIEEQQLREEEEKRRREEEIRLRQEKEEQEQKAREEAERARLELEDRLRKDEEERLARKKRVEAIMSRTRKTQGKETSPNSEGSRTPEMQPTDSSNQSPVRNQEDRKNLQNIMLSSAQEQKLVTIGSSENSNGLKSSLSEDGTNQPMIHKHDSSPSIVNGKRAPVHELSPVERLEAAVGNLLDFNSLNAAPESLSGGPVSTSAVGLNSNFSNTASLEQVLDFGTQANVQDAEEKLIQNDDVNSNIVNSNPLVLFGNQLSNTAGMSLSQEQHMTDLMS